MSDGPKWWWGPSRRRAYEEQRRLRAYEEQSRRDAEDARRRRDEDSGALGFAVGYATGIPAPVSPMAVTGAMLHQSAPSAPARAAETPSGYSPASYDGGSCSSSSYDSGSSASCGGGSE